MGDAKKRGTFEERRAAALARREEQHRAWEEAHPQGAMPMRFGPAAPRAPRTSRLAALLIASTLGR